MTLSVEIQTFMASQVDKVVPKHRILHKTENWNAEKALLAGALEPAQRFHSRIAGADPHGGRGVGGTARGVDSGDAMSTQTRCLCEQRVAGVRNAARDCAPATQTLGSASAPGSGEVFNAKRGELIGAVPRIILDESMSAWRPDTTKTGGLPAISFVLRKPEPLGTGN